MNSMTNALLICDTNSLIFLSMKSAKIKKSRKKKDMFHLENVDTRIYTAHNKFSHYRQQGIEVKTTTTILKEFDQNKIRKIVDEKFHFFNFAQRMHIIKQIWKKRSEIISKISPPINADTRDVREIFEEVKKFYSEPDKEQKLIEISNQKKRRNTLPETNDMIILSECHFTKKTRKIKVILLTNDSDFTEFCAEIKSRFDIEIDPI